MLHEHAIVDFVRAAFSTVTSGECYSWFKHAGIHIDDIHACTAHIYIAD